MNFQTLSLGAAVAFGSLALTVGAVSAYRGDPNVQGPNYTVERHQAMTQAFEKNDYQAWKSLMAGKGRVAQVVNEGNFTRFAEAHRQMLAGNTTEAQKIRAELGLGRQNQGYRGQGCAYMNR